MEVLPCGDTNKVLMNMEGAQIEGQSDVQERVNEVQEVQQEEESTSSFDRDEVEGQKSFCGSPEFEFDNENGNIHDFLMEPCLASESSLIVNTIESELPDSNKEGDLSPSEPLWLEGDESIALWVKWRGKWQAGIRCARADWPLSTLKAKPTHDRKNYFVIFFPHTRNYSWADMLLVRPINDLPQPIAYESHKSGLKMVKDLTVGRRFIMKKLALGMLNIIEQFHSEALIENARDMFVWKEFAMEVSRCNGYPDLGRMLLKLWNVILPQFIHSDWLQNSSNSWVQQCQNAQTAGIIEMLKEELFDSILWNEVNALRDSSKHLALGTEWRTWKQEVMKWFSTSQPVLSNGDVINNNRQKSNDPSSSSSLITSLQVNSRKRPKLEIRRADAHGSHAESKGADQATPLEIDSEFFKSRDLISNTPTTLVPAIESSDKWNGIVVEAGNCQDVEMVTPIKAMIGVKNRQCMAFIEAKGRQCVRWANEGDVYCCVHLSSRFTGNSSKKESVGPVETPMCQGTTVLGTRCKHRSLSGSSFCKKHKPYTETKPASSFSEYDKVKRKSEETFSSLETMSCNKRLMLGGDDNSSSTFQVGPVSILEKDSLVMEVEEQCIGSFVENKTDPCLDSVKRHSLYCEKHLPSWLKRARNGKTRIVSKEVFIDLLRGCSTKEEKVHLHQACELFYRLFKSIISLRNPVPKEVQFQWALSEASKVFRVKEYLTKLVSSEKERLKRIWGFGSEEEDPHPSTSSLIEEHPTPPLRELDGEVTTIRCKICSEKFPEDLTLSNHWMESHKKEAQWLFRSYACAICLDSFTNKKILETHVQERHHAQFVDHCMLLQCIACGSHFGNSDQLWMHVLSVHPSDLKLSGNVQDSLGENAENHNSVSLENDNPENLSGGGLRRFICRFCGLKFDLLPDLGRHHQAAHKGESLVTSRPSKKGIRYSAYRMKSGRLSRPKMKRSLAAASLRIRNRANASVKRRIQASKLLSSREVYNNNTYSDNNKQQSLGRLVGPECSDVAMILFSEIQKTKPRPSNFDVLSVARSVCCKVGLRTLLEEKYGELPERLYLKAAKLCSENNILVSWHLDGFVCPKGCNNNNNNNKLLEKVPRLVPCPKVSVVWPTSSLGSGKDELWVDECHYVMDSDILGQSLVQKRGVILCEDISFGKELVPIVCVGDKGCSDSHPIQSGHSEGENGRDSMPWESFTYITKPMLDQSLGLDVESLQWGCGCLRSMCCPKTCDHVYLFNNDYDDAKDIYGKPMGGRFPYDENGRIILEEGYLAYECNHLCSCSKNCPNRILQKGVQVKLEVFKKEKGWAVRAGEPILHGTFVCEYLGEVLEEQEATKRRKNRDLKAEGCLYFYDIDARNNDMKKLIEGPPKYVIDAEKYGNVSRFINHSCLPNLVKYQVLVESMDCQRAHVGLFANKDISVGEELTFDYQYEPSL